jgi:hypothetical protein
VLRRNVEVIVLHSSEHVHHAPSILQKEKRMTKFVILIEKRTQKSKYCNNNIKFYANFLNTKNAEQLIIIIKKKHIEKARMK